MKLIKVLLAALPISAAIASFKAIAQPIIPAGDTHTVVNRNGNSFNINGGQLSSDRTNLFHNFTQFSLPTGQIANFQSQPQIQNILSIITGGNVSQINGLIKVTGGNSHLFLINPSGLIFGPNASLNVPASFTATTAERLGFGPNWLNTKGNNNYSLLNSNPQAFAFTTSQVGSLINQGNLTLAPGQNLTLLGGTVISTGNLVAPQGEITVAAIPGSSQVRINQANHVLSLDIQPPTTSSGISTAALLPQLLTGGNVSSATKLTVNPNGTVQLTGSGLAVENGDVVVQQVQGKTATLAANHNLTLVESQLQTTGDLNLLAGETVRIRDSVSKAFTAQAGGNLIIRGNQGIDILALNHPEIPLQSGGDLTLISNGKISGDAHYQTKGNFSIRNLEGQAGDFFSKYDPVITSDGDVTFGNYTGASLKVVAGGDIQTGNIVINSIDPTLNPTNPIVSLQAGVAGTTDNQTFAYTDIASGTTFNKTTPPSSGNLTVGGNITTTLALPLQVDLTANGNIKTQGITTGGGNISLNSNNGIDTSAGALGSSAASGNGGNISITATNNIITGNINSGGTLNGGDITLISSSGTIDTSLSNLFSGTNFISGNHDGNIALTAAGNITTGALNSIGGLFGGNISVNSGGNIDTKGSIILSSGNLTGGAIALTANGNISVASITSSGNSSGNITLHSDGDINPSILSVGAISSSASNGSSGDITLTASGNITSISGNASSTNGNGGNISITASGNITSISGNASSTNGNGGNISITATNNIVTGNISSGGTLNGGDITLISSSGTIDTSLGNLFSGTNFISGNQAGNIALTAAGNITTGVLYVTGGSYGGNISINSGGNIDTLNQISSNGNVMGGAITLTANGNIAVTYINSWGNSSGNITLHSGGDINSTNTLPGSGAITSYSINGSSGDITLTANGNITGISGNASSTNGNGGNISITASGNITGLSGNASSTNGNGGNISITATNNIITGNISSGGTLNSGDITLISSSGTIDTSLGNLLNGTNFISGNHTGNIALTAAGNITTGTLDLLGGSYGGNISINSGGNIDNKSQISSSGNVMGGAIALTANGNIAVTYINSFGNSSGNITLHSGGDINSTNIFPGPGAITSYSSHGNSGDITLTANGNITSISANANSTNGNGGNISITASGNITGLSGNASSTNGNGGNISITATNNIITGNINSWGNNGGDITLISSSGAIDTSLGNLFNGTNFSGNHAGNIALTATGNITTGFLNSSWGVSGGNISVNSGGNIDTKSTIFSSGNAMGGAITLTANGNISVAGIASSGNSSGNITLHSGGDINPSILSVGSINSNSSNGNSGNISITASGNITGLSGNASSTNGNGGNISITASGNITGLSGNASSTNGNGGNISITATNNIITGNINSWGNNGGDITLISSSGAIDTSLGNLFNGTNFSGNHAGNIALTATGNITTGFLNSSWGVSGGNISVNSGGNIDTKSTIFSSGNAMGGAIALTANGNISVAGIASSGNSSGNITLHSGGDINPSILSVGSINSNSSNGSSGDITLTASGNITGISGNASSTNGNGGNISITANGNITDISGNTSSTNGNGGNISVNSGGNINTNNTISSNGNLTGGAIALTANGNINVFSLNSSSSSYGGNITLYANGNTSLNQINAQSLGGGVGGNVDITTNKFFQATGFFSDINGINASISTAGGTNGGTIIIRHGGQGITPFIVGDSGINGTTGAITRGATLVQTIAPTSSYLNTYTQDSNNLQIISIPAPVTPSNSNSGVTSSYNSYSYPAANSTSTSTSNAGAAINPNSNTGSITNTSNSGTATNSHSASNSGAITNANLNIGTTITNPISSSTTNNSPVSNPVSSNSGTATNNSPVSNPVSSTLTRQVYEVPLPTQPHSQQSTSTINPIAQPVNLEPIPGPTTLPAIATSLDSSNLDNAINQIEAARTSEYDNYLSSNPHLKDTAQEIRDILKIIADQTKTNPVVIYVIAYKQQLKLLLVTPKGPPILKTVPSVNRQLLSDTLGKFRENITTPSERHSNSYLARARQLYSWLISPLKSNLDALKVDTLLFSMDPGLRLIPLAALHDDKQFLIEQYSLGIIPSFSLTDSHYQSLYNQQVLAMGANKFKTQSALPAVPTELATITPRLWKGKSFLNEAFTLANLKSARNYTSFKIIHLATHAEFEPGNLSNSYIQLWDTRLTIDKLQELQWNPEVEMLVLSACQTAVGDNKLELGFAGLAVQAGVKSVLGSLWYVSDEGTLGLMSEFYQQLKTVRIKAEALRQAQLGMLHKKIRIINGKLHTSFGDISLPPALSHLENDLSHPYYWSAFTMIGNPW